MPKFWADVTTWIAAGLRLQIPLALCMSITSVGVKRSLTRMALSADFASRARLAATAEK